MRRARTCGCAGRSDREGGSPAPASRLLGDPSGTESDCRGGGQLDFPTNLGLWVHLLPETPSACPPPACRLGTQLCIVDGEAYTEGDASSVRELLVSDARRVRAQGQLACRQHGRLCPALQLAPCPGCALRLQAGLLTCEQQPHVKSRDGGYVVVSLQVCVCGGVCGGGGGGCVKAPSSGSVGSMRGTWTAG